VLGALLLYRFGIALAIQRAFDLLISFLFVMEDSYDLKEARTEDMK
jgi:hypothetical protein